MTIEVDVQRRLGDFRVATRFEAGPGVTALFGRSGAGKSSVVNMISGLLKPERGRIVVDGRVLFDHARRIDVPPRKRRIGYIFQESRLFPHMRVRGNLLYGRRFTPRNERFVGLDRIVELLGIGHLLARRPATLSGGERQRVAIGRALLTSPRLLLMDEPLASLDAARKNEILPYLERLRDELRLPIVYVSHLFEEVARLADTLVVMAAGRAVDIGPMVEIAARVDASQLSDLDQAGAVLEARVIDADAGFGLTRLSTAAGGLLVPRLPLPPRATLRVHIRAADVAIALAPPQGLSIQNVLPARLVDITDEGGASARLRLEAGGATLLARVSWKAVLDLALTPGRDLYALVKSVAIDRGSIERRLGTTIGHAEDPAHASDAPR